MPNALTAILPKLRDRPMYQGQDKLPLIVWMMAQVLVQRRQVLQRSLFSGDKFCNGPCSAETSSAMGSSAVIPATHFLCLYWDGITLTCSSPSVTRLPRAVVCFVVFGALAHCPLCLTSIDIASNV